MSIVKNSLQRILVMAALIFAVALCVQVSSVYADTISFDASAEGSNVTVQLVPTDPEDEDCFDYNMIITGNGDMRDYASQDDFPSDVIGKKVVSVKVEEGVNYVGSNCLLFVTNRSTIKSVILAESLEGIGDSAFDNLMNLNKITIPENVKHIGKKAFKQDLWWPRAVTINSVDAQFDETTFQDTWGDEELTFNIFSGGSTEKILRAKYTADTYVINSTPLFEFDATNSSRIVKYNGTNKKIKIPDDATVIASEAFQNDNGRQIVSLDLNKTKSVESNAFNGITSLKSVYAYDEALGQNNALGDGAFGQLSTDVTVYYKGEAVKAAFEEFGITQFVKLKPIKTAAAKNISKTVETGSEEEIDLNGMFDAMYETTLTETYVLEKDGAVVGSGNCVNHKYIFNAADAGEYKLTFKAKDSDGTESDDAFTVSLTALNNTAPFVSANIKHTNVRALVKNNYEINLEGLFADDDEGDSLTYYYTRDLSNEGQKTPSHTDWDNDASAYVTTPEGSSLFRQSIGGYSPTKVSSQRNKMQQLMGIAKVDQIYFYAVDRFGKKSGFYTVTVIPHSCSLEITADDPADLKGVTKKMIKTADDTEIEPVETVNGVAYYDLDDLESYKYVVKKKGFETVEQEFIQNQLEDNINWKGMAYKVVLGKDTNYDSAAGVDALIDAIGDIALTDESKAAIKAARDAYEALDDSAKALVEKYGKLEIAEKTLAVLQAQADLDAANDALSQAGADKQAALDAKTKAENDLAAANAALEKAKKDNQSASNEVSSLKNKIAAKELTVEGFKVKSKGKKFTVKWKKNPKAEGYVVQYKLKKSKKFKTLKTVTGTKAVSKKLKKGKKYQFRVATYKTVNGEKIYGKWTNVKTVKCK